MDAKKLDYAETRRWHICIKSHLAMEQQQAAKSEPVCRNHAHHRQVRQKRECNKESEKKEANIKGISNLKSLDFLLHLFVLAAHILKLILKVLLTLGELKNILKRWKAACTCEYRMCLSCVRWGDGRDGGYKHVMNMTSTWTI